MQMRKISNNDNCPAENRGALEDKYEVQSFLRINENEITSGSGSTGMLEHIPSPDNLRRALQQVASNKGASGIDGTETRAIKEYVVKHYDVVRQSIPTGNYILHAVRF